MVIPHRAVDPSQQQRDTSYSPTPSASMSQHHPTTSSSSSTANASTKTTAKRHRKMDNSQEVSATVCANCGTTTTPLWRRSPTGETICNACGLYLKARNQYRPPTLKRNQTKSTSTQQQQQQQQRKRLQQQPRNTSHHAVLTGQQQSASLNSTNAPPGSCPGGGQCNGTGGSASCEGCPAFNQHQVNRQHALICANCRTTTTPLWRRDEQGNTICNACGLYYKLHNVHRPVSMKRTVIKRRKRVIVTTNTSQADDDEDRDDEDHDDEGQDNEQDELESTSSEEGSRIRRFIKGKNKDIHLQNVDNIVDYDDREEDADEDDEDDEEKVKQRQQRHLIAKKRKSGHHQPIARNYKKSKSSLNSLISSPASSTSSAVPPIEDYVEPKRRSYEEQVLHMERDRQQQQQQQQQQQSLHQRLPPPPTTPPYHHSRVLPSLQPPSSLSASIPPTGAAPIKRFDPLHDYRSSNTTTSTPPLYKASPSTNQEINLPSLTSPTIATTTATPPAYPPSQGRTYSTTQPPPAPAPPLYNHMQKTSNNPYDDLTDFDEAMTRLERLRRRILPEQSKILATLTDQLEDVVGKAETILKSYDHRNMYNIHQQQQHQPQQNTLFSSYHLGSRS